MHDSWGPAAVALLAAAALAACDGSSPAGDAGMADSAGQADGNGPQPDGSDCFSVEGRSVAIVDVDVIGGAPIYPDLALGPGDRPWAVFTKGTTTSRFAAVASFDGTGWSAPDPVEQQDAVYLGQRPSIAIDSADTIHVVAYDQDGYRLHHSAKAASGSWSTALLYLDGVDAGDHSSLVLDAAGHLHVTFLEYGSYRTIYGTNLSGDWQFEPVGPGSGARAASSSLVLDPGGQPHVAFYTGDPDQMLRYALRTGSGWVVEDVDSTGDCGHYPSIALDPAGQPVVAALRWPASASEIRVATRGASGWQVETVDSELGITYTTGLAILPCGATLVAYARNEGIGTGGLWLAHRNPGASEWTRTSLDATTYVSGIDLVVTADGQLHVVYLDETNFILKHARL